MTNQNIKNVPAEENFSFVRKSVYWIEGRDVMDTCFVLNFGYEAPLPWPQVFSSYFLLDKILSTDEIEARWRHV